MTQKRGDICFVPEEEREELREKNGGCGKKEWVWRADINNRRLYAL